MPFDSSKQEFHDKMDILTKMNQKRAKSMNADKKLNSKKQESKKDDVQCNEYLAAFEQRKVE